MRVLLVHLFRVCEQSESKRADWSVPPLRFR